MKRLGVDKAEGRAKSKEALHLPTNTSDKAKVFGWLKKVIEDNLDILQDGNNRGIVSLLKEDIGELLAIYSNDDGVLELE